MLSLRPYQQEALDLIQQSESKRQLVSLPTGTGKTILFVALAKQRGKRTLILAHRDELISQAVDKLTMNWEDADVGVVKAERNELDSQVTVASVQTLARKRRLEAFPPNYDLLITDEAHHAPAESYRRIYQHLGCIDPEDSPDDELLLFRDSWAKKSPPLHLGVTATPNRSDGEGLDCVYDTVTYERCLMDFIPEYLSDLRIVQIQTEVSVDGVKMLGKDLNPSGLAKVLNTPEVNSAIYEKWREKASNRNSTLVFCASIEHAESLASVFGATVIHHKLPLDERRQILSDFLTGEIPVLVNVGILTEGYDNERIDCIVMARPTASEGLYMQMIGRGTRKFPGKADCLILDVACNSTKHRLISPADLFGIDKSAMDGETTVSEAVALGMPALAPDVELLGTSAQELMDTRKMLDGFNPNTLAWVSNKWGGWSLSLGAAGKLRIYSAKQGVGKYTVLWIQGKDTSEWLTKKPVTASFALSIGESVARENAMALTDRFAPWRFLSASDKQLAQLVKHKIPFESGITKGYASDLLSMYFEGGLS